MVDLTGSKIDFLFDHLAPGRYTVVFECRGLENETKNVTVDVAGHTVMADIVLSNLIPAVPPGPGTATPPANGLDILAVMSSLGAVVLLPSRSRKSRKGR